MPSPLSAFRLDQPASYQIKLLGRLGPQWAETLNDFEITWVAAEGSPAITTLRGRVADQAALFGLLSRIRDLGLPLLLVEYLPGDGPSIE